MGVFRKRKQDPSELSFPPNWPDRLTVRAAVASVPKAAERWMLPAS